MVSVPAAPSPSSDPVDAALREHADAARRLARHLVFDRDWADDVAQEAMRVSLVRPAAEGRDALPWLRGIVRNVARAVLRREARRPEVEARAFADREARRNATARDDPAALVARAEEHRRAVDAVLRLAEPYRAALILRFLEDLQPSEVAQRQGVPLETARTRIRRGLDLVRAELDAHHGGDRGAWVALLGPISTLPPPLAPTHAPPPACVPTSVPAPALVGVLAVKKLAAVALVLLLAGGAWKFFLVLVGDAGGGGGAEGPSPEASEVASDGATLAGRARQVPAADALPPPVALDAPGVIDRDRDIHGVVVREDGTPVAGADVSAVVRPWSGAMWIGSPARDAERALASTRTALDGTFAVRLERGTAATLRVSAAGLASLSEEVVGAGDRLRVVLHPAVRLAVVLRDAAGRPVGDATVRLYRLTGSTTWGYVRQGYRREGVTDAGGRFTFDDLPAGSGGTWTSLTVELPAVGEVHWEHVEIPEAGEVLHEVALGGARSVRGRVTDAVTKQPIVGAVVGVSWGQRPRATTDSDGRYDLSVAATSSSIVVSAEAPGYAWLEQQGDREDGTIDLALHRSATLRGRLVDAAGAPVADASLTAHGTMGGTYPAGRARARTTADGRFELVGLSPHSTSELWIEAAGFGRRGLALDAIGDDRERDLGDVVLAAGRRVEGRVVDDRGAAIAGVVVTITGASVEQATFWTGTGPVPGRLHDTRVTDDLGRFRFADVAPGDYRIVAHARGQEPREQNLTVRAADVEGALFTLRAGRALAVSVRGPDGAPLAWVRVQVRLADGTKHDEEAMGASEVAFTVPDEDVWVQVTGWQPGQQAPPAELVRRGTDRVHLRMRAGDVPWTIEGVAIGPDGAPLAFADVRVSVGEAVNACGLRTDRRGRFSHSVTNADRATFALVGTCAESATGEAADGAFEAEPVEVTRGTKDVVLRSRRVPAGQTLRVVVQDPEGRPLSGIPIVLQRPNGGAYLEPGVVDADGAVEFRNLVGRTVEVWRGSGAYTIGETWVDPFLSVVPAGQTVVFRFAAGTVVRGIVVGGDGTRIPHALVFANAGRPDRRRYTQTKADGSFAIALEPRRHVPLTLSVTQGGGSRPLLEGRAEFTVLPTEPVTIRLAPPPPR